MTEFVMSKHALVRAVDMALDPQEIRDAFERPRHTYLNPRTGSWEYERGRITLCISNDGTDTVKTILWAKASGWAADAEFAPAGGRTGELGNVRSRRDALKRKGIR